MRVAALYDVHGNLPALEAVLADVEQEQVDRLVFGGDVVAGPWPRETLDRVLGLGDVAVAIHGNADRDLDGWPREQLDEELHAVLVAWPLTAELEITGLGRVLFCHATPRDDTEIITRISTERRIRGVLRGVDADVVVHGHVHVRYDRRVAGVRIVNPGSVGLPYEGRPGAYWALLGPDVEHRRSEYDVDEMLAAARRVGFPGLEEHFGASLIEPLPADEVTQYFENLARGA